MEFDASLIGEFLIEAGCAPEAVAGLRPDSPLAAQGVSSERRNALADRLSEWLGAPPPSPALLQAGSLRDWSAFLHAHLDDETVKDALIPRLLAAAPPLPAGESYVIDRLRPEDALGAARLFHAIYGDKYPVVDYYSPHCVAALNRDRRAVTLVARLASGGIAGHGAYYRSSPPNPAVYEMGQIMVAPEYRQTSMGMRIYTRLDEISRSMDWVQAFYGEAVCNHLVTQKLVSRQDYSETGLELSLMPSGTYDKEGAPGRVGCVLGFRVDRDTRRTLHLPERYRAALELILTGLSLDRDIRFAESDAPAAPTTALTSRVFAFAQVERVQVATIGRDFPRRLQEVMDQARRLGLAVVQVWLNAGEPGVAFAAEALRREGFILGGLAPLWFGTDGLLFQWLAEPPDFASIRLHSDKSKAIFAHIEAEWRQSRGSRVG